MDKDYQDKIDRQEESDYQATKEIFQKIFGDKFFQMVKRKRFSPSDALFSAKTPSDCIAYCIEIKEVHNCRYLEDNGFVLKLTKYIQILKDSKERNEDEKCILIYLIPSLEEYYIYDLKEIDLNKVEMSVLTMKTTQFNYEAPTTQYAVMFLPKEEAKYVGYYQPNSIF